MIRSAEKNLSSINWLHYVWAIIVVVLITALLGAFRTNLSSTTVALSFLLLILFTATFVGRNPALCAAFASALSFNYFFLPPYGTLIISDLQNWIAWAAFTITAIVTGQLSAYARRRAEEAEKGRKEIEELYGELQIAFEQASHAEALRQSEKLKSVLLDAVTHDLRTPLTSIKAAVTSLIDDEHETDFRLDAEGKQEFLEIIHEETNRLNKFIEGMVELARFEAGAMQLRQTWSNVDEIVRTALTRAESLLKNHRVRLEFEKELPPVRVDAKALAEVIYTLLDNAVKYSAENTNLTITAKLGANETIEIAVTDEGRSITPEMREKVFEKFFRAELEDTDQKSVGGLGLGLAIARGIIESHGGKIWIVDGNGGRGTTIKLTVPIGDE
jgi:two-component system sensor histidine kinase KdpD